MKIKHIAIIIFALTIWFAFNVTKHFGYNWEPSSPAELVCDGITIIIFGIGCIISCIKD